MTRIRGFEEVADLNKDCGEFYTFTCPSRMHSHNVTGRENAKYDGSTIGESQEYLNHQWSLIRAELHRQNIRPYGFRVAEPHHDGTPHWHLLLFVPQKQRFNMRAICEKYLLQTDGDEAGAKKHRFIAVAIDPKKGTAAGYIAKYIAKNIDGAHVEKDTYGNDAKASAVNIEAWASAHRIRQFQQIGGPSVTVWRELRRLRLPHDNKDVELARSAADAGDWAAYVVAMGGVSLSNASRPLRPFKENAEDIDKSTGEITPKKNKLGEIMKPAIVGLLHQAVVIKTRFSNWQPALQPTLPRGCGFSGGLSPPKPQQIGGYLGLV